MMTRRGAAQLKNKISFGVHSHFQPKESDENLSADVLQARGLRHHLDLVQQVSWGMEPLGPVL